MATKVGIHDWLITEDTYHGAEHANEVYESIFSLGNGHMGIRGFFEEPLSSEHTLQGTYVGGVFFPDKTVVGWWKEGYPDHYDKTVNSASFLALDIDINKEKLDLAKWNVEQFQRKLDMKQGILSRDFTASSPSSPSSSVKVSAERFCSMAGWDAPLNDDKSWREVAAVSYNISPVNGPVTVDVSSLVDGDVYNRTAGGVFGHAVGSDSAAPRFSFWENLATEDVDGIAVTVLRTKKPWYKRRNTYWRENVGEEVGVPQFTIATALKTVVSLESVDEGEGTIVLDKRGIVGRQWTVDVPAGKTLKIIKYVSVVCSRNWPGSEVAHAVKRVQSATELGYDTLRKQHVDAWDDIWKQSDVTIDGDSSAQQGIRFNIFHLKQTYTGHDAGLNIGPKGFTGEVYGGATYWDTEAYCLPFVLSTAPSSVAKQLLVYRHKQLGGARHNARNMGLPGALYPMVTVTGEECHNEWEITFEEIHRNAAIPYGIYQYVQYTGDTGYLGETGLDVLIETSRFWKGRVHWNPRQNAYVMHGVTGPNEYEHNVNNNYYTNRMAKWNIDYTLDTIEILKKDSPQRLSEIMNAFGVTDKELSEWKDVSAKMYFKADENGVFEQHEGYFNKENLVVSDLDESELPLKMHWTWDKVLRSPFIKQADTLQALFFLNYTYTPDQKRSNFLYYEPRTVHDSSLSPSVHTILAAELGMRDKAYEMYLRSARLDLENVDRDSGDGLHVTAMAGTWLSVVHGFGGLRHHGKMLSLNPVIPAAWNSMSYKLVYRDRLLGVSASANGVTVKLLEGEALDIVLYGSVFSLTADAEVSAKLPDDTIVAEILK